MAAEINKEQVIKTLNSILEAELAGVVRYTHYSLMIFGYARIPIINWMRTQATESLTHACAAGEHITSLGGHPSLRIGPLLETEKHDIDSILREALEHESIGLKHYRQLLDLVGGKSVYLEEYARKMVHDEEAHITEVDKMIRRPGSLEPERD
jgi:bacterioferritin